MKEIGSVKPRYGEKYPVFVCDDGAASLREVWRSQWQQAAVVGDDTTLALFGQKIQDALRDVCRRVVCLSFPPGENHKTRATKEKLEDDLLSMGIDRSSCLVAVGGGIPLDVGGFVAATYMRGIDHVSIATTLLAQVDASAGGKTGVNTSDGKNLVGAFHHPVAVFLDAGALSVLPESEMINGMAELVKHAVIADRALFAELEETALVPGVAPSSEIIERAVQIKIRIINEDDREIGVRQILNFGHTVGHAIERASNYAVSHGRAVALGMVVESLLATSVTGFPIEEVSRLRGLLTKLGLPVVPNLHFDDVGPLMLLDKKNRGGDLCIVMPRRLGEMDDGPIDQLEHWVRRVSMSEVEFAWRRACSV